MTNLLLFKKKKLTKTDRPNDNGKKPTTMTKLLPKEKKNYDKPNDNRNKPTTMTNQKTIDHT